MQFNQSVRDAFIDAMSHDVVVNFRKLLKKQPARLHPLVLTIDDALRRTAPVPRTKEDKRGWRVKLSFPTYRKLVNQGYEVL